MVYKKTIKTLVTKGPSKMDLITALAYTYDKARGPFSVTFYMKDAETGQPLDAKVDRRYPKDKAGTPVAAKITGLNYEDGTGESFNLAGYLDYWGHGGERDFSVPFSGYYSAKDHYGTFSIIANFADDK